MSFAIVTVIVLILDQLMKFWVTKNIPLDAVGAECVELIPGVVHMTNVHNYGAAFNILENARWLLVAVTVLFVIAVIVLITQEIVRGRFGQWVLVLVMAGAIGNGLDRALYGYVVDMFEVEFMNFAVFNIADIFITVCGILLCLYIILHKESEEEKAAARSGSVRIASGRRSRAAEEDEEQAPVMRSRVRSQSALDAIPKRGEHKTLEEEFAPADPSNPFAEWNIDIWSLDDAEEPVSEAVPEEEPAAEEPAEEFAPEAPAAEPGTEADDGLDFGDGLDFSLDDILSEFGG